MEFGITNNGYVNPTLEQCIELVTNSYKKYHGDNISTRPEDWPR